MADSSQNDGSSQEEYPPNTTQNIFGDESMADGATQMINTQMGGSMPSSSYPDNNAYPESSDAPNPGESSSALSASDAVLFGDSGQTQDYV